jgi:hypothetical protein
MGRKQACSAIVSERAEENSGVSAEAWVWRSSMENGSGWTSEERAGRGSLSDAPQLSKRLCRQEATHKTKIPKSSKNRSNRQYQHPSIFPHQPSPYSHINRPIWPRINLGLRRIPILQRHIRKQRMSAQRPMRLEDDTMRSTSRHFDSILY